MKRDALIRPEPCPRCGSHMLWSPSAWRVPERVRRQTGPETAKLTDAFVCMNDVCGAVLNPTLYPRTAH